ncbi:uncharacterized protein ARMOST_03996 [Armillaria ostoyae]|uniref:Uncharacterized protein n=1 Tax=Armillaria ostoyae TaxID=47428 RepID=A0A284QW55_ARMOS|nr:uncharacterized protein ARMOST_03996 [Armillaria ostoyae]
MDWGHSSQSVSELHRVRDQMPEEFYGGATVNIQY